MSDPHVVRPGTLPTPFTAAEIRDGTSEGMTLIVRSTPRDGAPSFRRITFVKCDAEGALRSLAPVDATGTVLDDEHTTYATWEALQGHAAFEESVAQRSVETRKTALGTIECIRFDVRDGDKINVYWFSPNHPGMPIVLEMRDPDGEARVTLEVISRV